MWEHLKDASGQGEKRSNRHQAMQCLLQPSSDTGVPRGSKHAVQNRLTLSHISNLPCPLQDSAAPKESSYPNLRSLHKKGSLWL